MRGFPLLRDPVPSGPVGTWEHVADNILKPIETQSVKDKLRQVTAEPYDRGARGVPTIAVEA